MDAIDVLRKHNQWRRGEINVMPHSPKEIGEAIDAACARIAQLEAELAAARKVPEQYSLSRDYKALFAFICAGNVAAGYVHPEHDKFCDGDVVGITRRGPWQVHVGVRGCSFFSLYQFNSEDGPSEEEQFIKGCEWCGLEWIEPVCAAAPQEPKA